MSLETEPPWGGEWSPFGTLPEAVSSLFCGQGRDMHACFSNGMNENLSTVLLWNVTVLFHKQSFWTDYRPPPHTHTHHSKTVNIPGHFFFRTTQSLFSKVTGQGLPCGVGVLRIFRVLVSSPRLKPQVFPGREQGLHSLHSSTSQCTGRQQGKEVYSHRERGLL